MHVRKTVLGAAALAAAAGATGSVANISPVHAQHAQAAVKKVLTTEVNDKYVFKAKTVTIAKGTKVTWSNPSDAPHTVTFKTGGAYDQKIATGATLSRTFSKAGTYQYFCKYHPGMVGKIVVK